MMPVSPDHWTQQPDFVDRCIAMIRARCTSAEVAAAVGAPTARCLRNRLVVLRRQGFKIPFFFRGIHPASLLAPPNNKKKDFGCRPCLRCRKNFRKAFAGNFICKKCEDINSRIGLYGGLY